MSTNKEELNKDRIYNGDIPDTPLRFLRYSLSPFKLLAFSTLATSVITQLIAVFIPLYISRFIDASSEFQSPDEFALWAFAFVGINIFFYATYRIGGLMMIPLILGQNRYSFHRLQEYLLTHSHSYFSDRFAGSVVSKMYHAVDRSSEIAHMLYGGFVRLLISLVGGAILFAFVSFWLAFIYAVIILLTIFINMYLVKLRRPFVVEFAKSSSFFRGQLTDVITNVQAARQYSRLWWENDRLNDVMEDRVAKDYKQWRMAEWNYLINNSLAVLLLFSMVGGTYWLLINGQSTIGEMVMVMIVMYRLSGVMIDIGDWMNRMVRAYGEVEEGLEDILVDREIENASDAKTLVASDAEIQWQSVTFEYGSNTVFDEFNLSIPGGQRLGLVGQSGAGKTTFVSLLLRQHDIDGGEISIDGQNIAEVTQDSLRENIAVVPQEPALFHRTIRENIAYGKPDATDEEIVEVAKKAEAHGFISELEKGYDTLVGERGIKLSGGQKQRVAIARAMLKDAPILVLDEATSALDSESESAIQKALEKLMEGRTVIAIAHRLSTLRKMDRIIVMEEGKIKEDGTHESLSQSGGTYEKLWNHQAGGFLLEE